MVGVVTGRGILKAWRVAILVICVVSALATPVADLFSMFLLVIPLTALYFSAVGIALLNDKRKNLKLSKLMDEEPAFD
jgi:sec-independent protein translocase protein TatC